MLRNRLLILLGGCFLAASAAWADDVGYIDCSSHPEGTQVFGKPRKTPDVVASLPCGERFTILVYGFVFSRIATPDGKVGYVYSNLIAVDRAATTAQQAGTMQMAAAKSKVPSTRTTDAMPAPAVPEQPQPAPAQPASTPASVPTSPAAAPSVPETPAPVAHPNPSAPAQPQPAPAQLAPAQPSVPASSAPVSMSTGPAPTVVQPGSPEPASPAPSSKTAEVATPVAQPDPSAPAQPQPTSAQPGLPAIRPAETRGTWERPNPGGVHRAPRVELFGGYAFARLAGSGGTSSNLNGALGSFGWNFKPWLQIVADSSYSVVTISGTKNVLYGNHFGPRYFHRGRNRWGLTPFVEALVGGSRADTTITGVGGYTTSNNCLSYKAGGGLDIHPSRRWEIRLFDIDYYRTSFGTNVHQNNYWASTGIVLHFFGGSSDY